MFIVQCIIIIFNLHNVLQFCCNPRKIIKAFVSPKDMSEFVEAAKRLNVASASQIQTMMVNADPTKVEATLGEILYLTLKKKINIK